MSEIQEISTDLLVIGAGPGGYEAAIYAAKSGLDVVIAEKGKCGGTCLNIGCIPTKALVKTAEVFHTVQNAGAFGIHVDGSVSIDMGEVQSVKKQITETLCSGVQYLLQKNKIRLLVGSASFEDEHTVRVLGEQEWKVQARNILIATGSVPAVPPIPGMALHQVLDSTAALALEELPSSVTIIGGGVIGMEFAFLYSRLGVKVEVVEFLDRILTMVDKDVSQELGRAAKRTGIVIHTSSRVSAIEETEDGKAQVTYEDKKGVHTLVSDKVLAAVGRKPFYEGLMPEKAGVVTAERGRGIPVDAFMRTNVAHIYAIGDVTNRIQLAHCASHQGFTAVDHICGKEHEMNYEIIPNVIFTAPEIASVGMTEAKAKEAAAAGGPEYAVSKFPFAANGKAMTMQETSGFAKLICRKEDGKVLGGSIIGPDASSLAGVLSLAVSCGLKAEDIADTVFAHPTTAEAIGEAAMGFGKGMINF